MRKLIRAFRPLTVLIVFLFVLQIAVVLFGYPRPFIDWLTAAELETHSEPAVIVVLGGGGIPSESGLIRTYYGAAQAHQWPRARVVVALPAEHDPELDAPGDMKRELILRRVEPDRIMMEHHGRSTWEQAEGVHALLGDAALDQPLLIISTPTHLRRSVLCFKKAGFTRIGVAPADNVGVAADLGGSEWLRYIIWNRLKSQSEVLRELTAMLVYRLKGWI